MVCSVWQKLKITSMFVKQNEYFYSIQGKYAIGSIKCQVSRNNNCYHIQKNNI